MCHLSLIFGIHDSMYTTILLIWKLLLYVEELGKVLLRDNFCLVVARLLSDANYYEKHFLNSSNAVVLMFRIEHMMQYSIVNQAFLLTAA